MSFTLELMPLVTYLLAVIGVAVVVLAASALALGIPAVRQSHLSRQSRDSRGTATARHAFGH